MKTQLWLAVLFFLLLALARLGAARSLPMPGMPPAPTPKPVDREQTWIRWGRWCARVGTDFRFRTGYRYAGQGNWEHYLLFEEHPACPKAAVFCVDEKSHPST